MDARGEIEHDEAAFLFRSEVDGHAGLLAYELDGDTMRILSTEVPEAIGGRGIAGALTQAALDHARAEGWKVEPVCPYVQAWIERHPDYADLVAGPA